jgi:predicted PurR-regulated permease PerM
LQLTRLKPRRHFLRQLTGFADLIRSENRVHGSFDAVLRQKFERDGVTLAPGDVRVDRHRDPDDDETPVREGRLPFDRPSSQAHPCISSSSAPGRPILPRSSTVVPEQRVVTFRPRTVLAVIGIVLAVVAILAVVWISRQVLTWIIVAIFLALALNPAVEFFQGRGLARRGLATAVTMLLAIGGIVALGSLFLPTLVNEGRGLAEALPGYVNDVSEGRGPLGRLAERYQLEERVRDAVEGGGGVGQILGLSGTAIAVTKSVLTFIVAVVTIVFLTFFMLLEGPKWMERFYGLLPDASRNKWRKIGHDIYLTVGGYVSGNLVISLIAGIASTVVLMIMGVPYAVALGVLVAILDLIPLAGATLAAIIVSTVAFIHSIQAGIVVLIFFIVYQQLENHVLQPLVYSRTVQLSPLAILIAVLIGAKIAGILGALAAIPVAGTIQVLLLAWLAERRQVVDSPAEARAGP